MIKKAPQIRKVLFTCLSGPEGVIFWTPLACALRKQWPFCQITWVTDELECELLLDNQAADRVIVFPGRRWRPPGMDKPGAGARVYLRSPSADPVRLCGQPLAMS